MGVHMHILGCGLGALQRGRRATKGVPNQIYVGHLCACMCAPAYVQWAVTVLRWGKDPAKRVPPNQWAFAQQGRPDSTVGTPIRRGAPQSKQLGLGGCRRKLRQPTHSQHRAWWHCRPAAGHGVGCCHCAQWGSSPAMCGRECVKQSCREHFSRLAALRTWVRDSWSSACNRSTMLEQARSSLRRASTCGKRSPSKAQADSAVERLG